MSEARSRQAFSARDLEQVVSAARRAGGELLRLFRLPPEELEVGFKGPRDLVTSADRTSESILIEELRRCFPGDAMLSEERATEVAWGDRVWIIDPLDGTTNFTHGHPFFAVSVALSEGKSLLAGVVHAPALGETYWARAGGGAFLNGDPIRVAAPTRLQESLLATGFSYGRKEVGAGALERFGELLLGAREIRRGGSASLDLAYTASGTFSGFWEYHLKPHDVAAGALLVEEAGGIVTDVAGGRDFLLGGSIAAGNRAIHARLLETLKKGPRHPGAAARVSPGAGGARPATAPRAGR